MSLIELFVLASGLHELISGVSWLTHSLYLYHGLPPSAIGSVGVFFSTPPCCPPTGIDGQEQGWNQLAI